jgi:LacI family transcriptional regulator
MSRSTIKEIAKALNLSVSTVSRALRDSYEISVETKAKVIAYAQSVNYRPDPMALGLKERKSHSICVIVPEIANNFFSEVINGIDSAAYAKGYNIFIFQSHEDYKREIQSIELGLDRRVDGFIISLSGTTDSYDHLEILKKENIPVVYFDRVPPFDDVNKVVVDNFRGSYIGTSSLIENGRKRIANLSSVSNLSITKERHAGYLASLKDHGIEVDEILVKFCGFDPTEAHEAIKEIILKGKPDAFLINSDRLTLNSLTSINQYSHLLDGDVQIIGFTNMKYVDLLSPKMIPICQPANEIGKKTVEILMHQIESKNINIPVSNIVLETEMIVH